MSSSLLTKRSADDAKLDEPSNGPTKRQKKNANYYDIFGTDARVEIEIRREVFNKKRNSFLSSKDFHCLLLWILGETVSPKWIFIKHRPLITKVIIVQMDNLSEAQMIAIKEEHSKKQKQCRLVKDSASNKHFAYFSKFNYCPLQLDVPKFDKSKSKHPSFKKLTIVSIDKIKSLKTNKNLPYHYQQQKSIKKCQKSESIHSIFGNKYKFAPELMLCSKRELMSNGYPNYNDPNRRFEHFFSLPPPKSTQNRNELETESDTSSNSTATSPETVCCYEKMVGLDCEMVVTTAGVELARISVVNEEGKCIYDELVLPMNEITDYCTKYSGITSKILENVTKRLSDIHSDLSLFLNSDSIICGHGLENDFCAMQMVHLRVIDTAICYPHHSSHSYKNKLRYLAQKYLSRNIQQSQDGHSSDEDALAALDLVKLKLQFGPEYGLPKKTKYASIFTVLHHFEKKSCLIGPHDLFAPISAATPVSSIPTVNDEESVIKVVSAMKKDNVDLIWCYLREHAVECLYDNLVKIYEEAEENTVIIAASGKKDFNQLNELKMKQAKAIQEGKIREAEEYAEKVRRENFNAKQYPFWIFVKHNDDDNQMNEKS